MMRRLITLQDHKYCFKLKNIHSPTHILILTYSQNASFLLITHRGNTIDLSLSGQRALEFNAEAVFDIGQNHHVIAIFVCTLMKIYIGKTTNFSVELQHVGGT